MRTDPPQPVKSRKEQAEILALQMVQFVLREETTAVGFLQATGITPEDLRHRINEIDFLGGVIDYMLGREDLLVAFCAEREIEPASPARLRDALP